MLIYLNAIVIFQRVADFTDKLGYTSRMTQVSTKKDKFDEDGSKFVLSHVVNLSEALVKRLHSPVSLKKLVRGCLWGLTKLAVQPCT